MSESKNNNSTPKFNAKLIFVFLYGNSMSILRIINLFEKSMFQVKINVILHVNFFISLICSLPHSEFQILSGQVDPLVI